MKCYYEVLQVDTEATDDEIKKSYRKLALQWHPDKNPDRADEAKVQFQLIQQAYEVLIDPQERSWYDRHKDSILRGRGSDYKDDSVDIYPYFTSSCYTGFGDDAKGFYSVYSDLFKRIADEDLEFNDESDSEFEMPVFGDSTSQYDEVVHPFYSYWESYSTKKSFTWLDIYDLREAPNRRIAKLMEKDNKKIRDQAKKERNDEIRALVAFVRKRDKRVKAYLEYLEKKAEENAQKTKEKRKKQIEKRQKEMDSYVECDWAKFSNLEGELREIEANLKTGSDDELLSEDDENDPLYCVACNKVFKTEKAFSNHERSKKHKENVAALRIEMEEDDELARQGENDDEDERSDSPTSPDDARNSDTDSNATPSPILTKKKKVKQKKQIFLPDSSADEIDPVETVEKETDDTATESVPVKSKKKLKKKEPKQTVPPPSVDKESVPTDGGDKAPIPSFCAVCKEEFPSKNGLFKHLKSTGHAVPPGKQLKAAKAASKSKSKRT